MKTKINLIMLPVLITAGTLFAQTDMGIYYYHIGDYEKAKIYLTKEASDNLSENNFYLGEIAFAENNLQEAEEYYHRGLNENPDNIHNQIGLAKLKLKANPREAVTTFNAIQKKKGKDMDATLSIGRAYLDNKMLDMQNFLLPDAKTLDSKSPDLQILEGDIIMAENEMKKIGEAAGKYEWSNYYHPDFILGYIKTAQVYENINPTVAIEKWKTVIEKQPDCTIAYGYLGKVYTQNGFYPQAIDAYDTYFQSGVYSVDDLERYARALYFSDNFDQAKKVVNEGLSKEPGHFVLNRYKMYIYAKTKETDKGLETAHTFFSLREPSGYISQDYKMYASLLNDAKHYEEALLQYDKAIDLETEKMDLYTEAAAMARDNKDYAKAACYLKRQIDKKAELSNDDSYQEDVVDINTLGYDYYSAGVTIARNQLLAEKLMKNQKITDELLAANANLKVDSLKNNIIYFTKNYSSYYLNKADSVFDILIERVPDGYSGYRFKALTKHAINPETETGLAKPYYEKVVEMIIGKEELTSANKRVLLEAYNYLGYYYYMKSDKGNTILYWNKVLEIDPENKNAKLVLDDINK